ncbi:MAG TPA: type II toxin-antitoxin system VapC family toxin [Herpetosiphonaceae bacterium]|nr:type II toxin-antitoxin system VapC family toxin [Herpetosiphonaceae bacterium]
MATTAARRLFVDTNLLIFATDPASPLNRSALDMLQQARDAGVELVISPQVLREYLAAATRASVLGAGSGIADILRNFRTFRTRFTVLEDNPAVLDHLEMLVTTVTVAGKQIHDGNIVATMLAHGVRALVTHNVKDFARFNQFITIVSFGTSP